MYDSTVTSISLLVTFSAYWRLTRCGPFDKICLLSSWVFVPKQQMKHNLSVPLVPQVVTTTPHPMCWPSPASPRTPQRHKGLMCQVWLVGAIPVLLSSTSDSMLFLYMNLVDPKCRNPSFIPQNLCQWAYGQCQCHQSSWYC